MENQPLRAAFNGGRVGSGPDAKAETVDAIHVYNSCFTGKCHLKFSVRLGSGPDAKGEAVDVKYFHSSLPQMAHRKISLFILNAGVGSGPDAKV